MKKLILIIIIAIIPIYLFISYNNFKNSIIFEKQEIIEIKKWETYYSLAEKLNIDKNYLRIYLNLNKPKWLQAWNYEIKAWTNINWLVETLEWNAVSNDISITIIEWLNIYDIDSILSKKNLIKTWEFITYNKENFENLKKEFPFLKNAVSLEWFLYPDTYKINPNNFSLDNFVKTKFLANFEKKVIKWLNLDPNDKNLQDIIILASIVEKEEKNSSEKATVAWILKKRLKEWWQIWADATVCYPYQLTYEECTPNFIWNHINDKNKYNTRTMHWLPETPICNPNDETIEATINSKDSPYYFYLHDKNAQIHYATTNEEHEANKSKYLK